MRNTLETTVETAANLKQLETVISVIMWPFDYINDLSQTSKFLITLFLFLFTSIYNFCS